MGQDYDKQQWQDEQAARDAAIEKQREKDRKSRERAARKYQRKLERLHRTLTEQGVISDFEDEFGTTVLERLETYGSAFHDLEKGRSGDALSFAQKSVLAQMNKKVKALKKTKPFPQTVKPDSSHQDTLEDTPKYDRFKPKPKKRSSFQKNYTPRVRHIEDDFDTLTNDHTTDKKAHRPLSHESKPPGPAKPMSARGNLAIVPADNIETAIKNAPQKQIAKRPFLRLVPK